MISQCADVYLKGWGHRIFTKSQDCVESPYETAVMNFPIIGAIENGSDDDASCRRISRLHDLDVPHLCVGAIGEPEWAVK